MVFDGRKEEVKTNNSNIKNCMLRFFIDLFRQLTTPTATAESRFLENVPGCKQTVLGSLKDSSDKGLNYNLLWTTNNNSAISVLSRISEALLDKHVDPGGLHSSGDAFPRGHHAVLLFGGQRQPRVGRGRGRRWRRLALIGRARTLASHGQFAQLATHGQSIVTAHPVISKGMNFALAAARTGPDFTYDSRKAPVDGPLSLYDQFARGRLRERTRRPTLTPP